MKLNWKSIFGAKKSTSKEDFDETYYDRNVEFYYSNLINSLVLFSFTTKELEKLAGPLFNPMSELETEIDYAFLPVCFETIFRNDRIDSSLKSELLDFKKKTDDIPAEVWDWEFIDTHELWVEARKDANDLLNKLGIKGREYNDEYETIYDNEGNVIKKGKTVANKT